MNVEQFRQVFDHVRTSVGRVLLGQEYVVEQVLLAIMARGHVLIDGVPGLGKTKLLATLGQVLDVEFGRVQFTPDLMPADILGTNVIRDGRFEFHRGPIFHNLVLADEVNRAPAKVQSALLEAMAEHQVSVGRETYPLPELFLVMATQNPIEQEGTYPLPEAQLDRFLMHTTVGYPDGDAEHQILDLVRAEAQGATSAESPETPPARLDENDIFAARRAVALLDER